MQWTFLQKPGIQVSTRPKSSHNRKTRYTHGHVDCVWNVMAHAQKPDFVFRRNGRVHLNWQGSQFSRLLVAEVCASAVVMLDTHSFEVVWRVLATHSIRQFPLHFPSRASLCAITFQLDSTSPQSYFPPETAVLLRTWIVCNTADRISYLAKPKTFVPCLNPCQHQVCAPLWSWISRSLTRST